MLKPIRPALFGFSGASVLEPDGEEGWVGVPVGPTVEFPPDCVGEPVPVGPAVRRVVMVVESSALSPSVRLQLMDPSWTGLVAMRAGFLKVKTAEPGFLPSASLKAWHETALMSASVTETILRPQTDSISGTWG